MNYKVLIISFILIMTLGYGGLQAIQGTDPTMIQKVVLTLSGMTIANLIGWQWKKEIG